MSNKEAKTTIKEETVRTESHYLTVPDDDENCYGEREVLIALHDKVSLTGTREDSSGDFETSRIYFTVEEWLELCKKSLLYLANHKIEANQ